jgi:deoxyadenosine/deoxycytidine kinase
MQYVNIEYSLESLKERIAFHARRWEQLRNENKNPKLQEIHQNQLIRFAKMIPECEKQGFVYIDKMM